MTYNVFKKVKVKASHTRHRALGPELICFICSICNFSIVQLSFYLPVVQLFYLVSLSHMYIICAFIAIIIIISSFIIEVAL